MPTYIELPPHLIPSKLADWMEINALLDPDGSTAAEDLLSPLRAQSEIEEDQIGDSEAEILVTDIFSELRRRTIAAGKGYPFDLAGEKINKKNEHMNSLPYVFCLLISFFGVQNVQYYSSWKSNETTKKFEELSALAVRSLLDNQKLMAKVEIFGWPRRWKGKVTNPAFRTALTRICSSCGEMKPKDRPAASTAKDAGLDVLAWKQFPDKLCGGILFWGQCAAGSDWDDKLGDVKKFQLFLDEYTPPITGTFIPHITDTSSARAIDEWAMSVQQGGMMFNRCRIAYLARDWNDKWARDFCKKALKGIGRQC